MLNYFNSPEKINKEFNTAYIKENNLQCFHFAYTNREDITNNTYLSNIELSNSVYIVETTDDITFTTDNTILINEEPNHIRSIYIEYPDNINNQLNIKAKKRTFLTLVRDF